MPLASYILFMSFTAILCLWMNFYFTNNFWWFKGVGYIQSFQAYVYQVLIYCSSLSASLVPILILLLCFSYLRRTAEIPITILYIQIAIGCIIFARFVFFPSLENRFMTAFYICSLLLSLELLGNEKVSESWLKPV